MKKIKDEFTKLKGKYSRQRLWQMRKKKLGLCLKCGEKAVTSQSCLKHAVYQREWFRKFTGNKRRNKNSLIYQLEKNAKK